MTLATDSAHQLRFRVNDLAKRQEYQFFGDGTAATFQLNTMPGGIVTGQGAAHGPSAYVPIGSTAWSATGCTFDYRNATVAFSGVISANSAILTTFYHGTFGIDEIDFITANYGAGSEGVIAAVEVLMADASKRASWAGGGVSYNEAQTFNNLKAMRDTLWKKLAEESGPQGGFESWADNQADFG